MAAAVTEPTAVIESVSHWDDLMIESSDVLHVGGKRVGG